MVRSPDGDTAFFEITTGVLQGDTLAPFLFILCLDYILKTSVDINAELGFTLTERRSRRYPATHITDIDYADDIAITTNDMKSANTLLHQIEVTSNEIGLSINTEKTQYMKLNQNSDSDDITINSINGKIIAKVENVNYLGSCIGSTEKDIQIRIAKAWSALNSMQEIWKSKMPDKLKRNFFRAAVESVLVYGAISWTLTAKLEGKLYGAYTRMLRAALNKSWREHLTNKELYGNIPKISVAIREQRLRFAGHCWRSEGELASDLLLWQPYHGKRFRGRPPLTYIDQLVKDTGCRTEELPAAMKERDKWKERVVNCRASSTC